MRTAGRAGLLALALATTGCSGKRLAQPFAPPHYDDGPAGLKQLWGDILDAARKDERERVHDLLATTIMSDEQMRKLFGPAIETQLPRYHQLTGTLANRGALELVAQVAEKKYDTIDIFDDDHDAAVQAALQEPHPLLSARVRKASDTRGLRYDCFLYLDGAWKTGNQLGKFMTTAPSGATTAAASGATTAGASGATTAARSAASTAAAPSGATTAAATTSAK